MSHLSVRLSIEKPNSQWSAKAPLSFDGNGAVIHVAGQEQEQLRAIRKAARLLDGMAVERVQLQGQWQLEQQWAFASSYTTPKRINAITWCEDENQAKLEKMYQAMLFTRALINRTPEELSPQKLADEAQQWLQTLGGKAVTATQIIGEQLQEKGWVGIYQVGRGSDRPPVMLELDYNPSGDANAPVAAALVGKGITFDSGGYSIKTSEGMLTMKCDMGGAATVTGGLGLAISQGLNKRVKLFLCCAENLISGHAYKLGDILTYKNGLKVEIVNTDAEGRLVLADGLMAAGETGAPLIIDAATLTGAAVMAVGSEYNALFGLDKALQQQFLSYASEEREPAWPLPLEVWHQEQCPSPYADTANSRPVKGGGAGGASNAAGFLSRFVPNQGQGWVHMDLAAAFNNTATPLMPAGATAQGIRTIAKALLQA
ncbi:aminopeptidase PepB [Aliiglaciecola sp. CAU 1673]|uniref:aminopeptidase PepB n=1 Tax=Aliiglaciecola sp. CAU 1673 TaxID=3032595 RepID=UPI0023DA7160|nr:aminopeptidase PepB [Aliiglaciecola sp. CAU 1673]MDF2177811.1 aminopeptidase PepB [Aliiglaciecola sp. CAU 1673]